MRIREVSNIYGISLRTLRYYEEIEILNVKRDKAGNRIYGDSTLKALEMVIILKELNLSLKLIKTIIQDSGCCRLNEILKDERIKLDKQLVEINQKKQYIDSIINTFGSKDVTKATLESFFEEQIFFSQKNERMNRMIRNLSRIKLEVGKGIVDLASFEAENSLLLAIKKLRIDIAKSTGEEFDKIHVTDNEDLKSFEYRLVFDGKICVEKNLEGLKSEDIVKDIIDEIAILEIKLHKNQNV
ncbi:MAG: MerR family transcriptional regulator [Tissierellales bacterium]|jgi:DNA-binding transcriptional MerR regulator|nr:MerR family transcriptional regulator [Tissierellales bacterium]